jgi:hypothetical protein
MKKLLKVRYKEKNRVVIFPIKLLLSHKILIHHILENQTISFISCIVYIHSGTITFCPFIGKLLLLIFFGFQCRDKVNAHMQT